MCVCTAPSADLVSIIYTLKYILVAPVFFFFSFMGDKNLNKGRVFTLGDPNQATKRER